ncbi:extracellular solute-binding protein family 5 [Parafrankia sp. EAN1pec]|uniref:ABC transporter substrate-binding protein n=1 Tax=Parafrankia sp. (strain EAN1pec) TaxID=298653 RepID=UPI00005404F9|nr:extracellular solute-binding protein family 5 [Frankia sp. EAN1pec]
MIRGARLGAVAVTCCAALVLAACGGGESDGSSRTSENGASGATGNPVPGGEGRILLLSEPRSLDPAALNNVYAAGAAVGNALYGTLMTNNEAGEIQYSMAESFTTPDNGATFELKLRPGLAFSDGTALTAEAVKYNWDRIKDPKLGAFSRAEAAMIASSEVEDETTLKVTMVAPVPKYAQAIVTSTLNWIAEPAALEKGQQKFDTQPIGAGPFTLSKWTRQAEMELVRNTRYWDAPKPYLDRLSLRPATDSSQRYNTVLTGGADLAVESSWVNLDKAKQARLSTNVMQLSGGIFIALNLRSEPFSDIRARQALAAAIDIETLNLAAYSGTAEAADTLFSKISPYHSDVPLHTTDHDKAQRLFDELAGEGKPVTFTFKTPPTTENRAVAENIQTQLSTFRNVKAEVKVIEVAEFSQLRTTHDFDAAASSALFQDPDPRLTTTFAGDSPANLTGIDDAVLNESLQAGRVARTEAEAKDAYVTVQERLAVVTPVIFTVRAAPSTISSPNVGGIVQYGIGSLLPSELWIKP